MNDKLKDYLDGIFHPYNDAKSIAELKDDLLADLQEKYAELKAEGKDEQTAFDMTVESIGDIEETVQEMANLSHTIERKIVINFKATNLPDSVLTGLPLQNSRFHASALKGADFSGSDLTGSSFKSSDLADTRFDQANLTDCVFSSNEMKGAHFGKSRVVQAKFEASSLNGAIFDEIDFVDTVFTKMDMGKSSFCGCTFEGGCFKLCDMTGFNFDNTHFNSVVFDNAYLKNASFRGATLQNVAFKATRAITNKFYKALATVNFDGAKMDKLTYAGLKSIGIELPNASIL